MLLEGLPESHSTQGGRRVPEAVLASSASAGLSSVKRVAAQQSKTTEQEEEEKRKGEEEKEEPQPQPLLQTKRAASEIRVVPR